jgi:OOP family OmpA-OmpF porin
MRFIMKGRVMDPLRGRTGRRATTARGVCALSAALVQSLVWAQAPASPTAPGAEPETRPPEGRFLLTPADKRAWLGIDFGQARYSTGCGFGGYRCKNPDLAGRAHVGGLFNRYLGAEIGYLHLGDADRAGGTTSAKGLNFSLLGRWPAGPLSAHLKLGATYGRTEVTADPLSGVPTGRAKGWGASYGMGLSYEVARSSALVIEWERHDLRFPGAGKHEVQLTTFGYRYQF